MTAINGTQNALSPEAVEQAVALLHRPGRCSAWDRAAAWPPQTRSAPVCLHHQQVPCHRRQPYAVMAASLMTPAGRGAVRFLLRRYPGYDGEPARGQGQRRLKSFRSPITRIPPAQSWRISCCCAAQESPLDSGNIPIKVAVLYVAEVLVLRYMLDDKPRTHRSAGAHHRGAGRKAALSINLEFQVLS